MLRTESTTLVTTRQGTVRGAIVDGIHVFRGVPFAAPPFGPDRLRPPRPPEPWDGIRDATQDGPIPPQLLATADGGPAAGFIPAGAAPGEDCLNLNIWTPDPAASGLPVMVWITGGSFQFGAAGWYDGGRFARDGMVLVSINYRAGPEGFLVLRDGVPNRGLLDQVAALEWVRDSIGSFGGDPAQVTVCGESAGAMSIGMLLAMPRAKGLFRRAILQSGAAHFALPAPAARRIGEELALKLGVAPRLDAIAQRSADELIAAHEAVRGDLMADPDPRRWGADVVASTMLMQPVVDGVLLPDVPLARIRDGAAAEIDVLVGTNADDWRLFLAASGQLGQISEDQLAGPVERHGSLSAAAYGVGPALLAAYRAARPGATPGDLLVAIQTDWWCRVPALRLVDAHCASTAQRRTWMYEFAWASPVADGLFGSCHALEIPFVFDTLDMGPAQMLGNLLGDRPPGDLARRMHAAWVSFVARGDPGWPADAPERHATMRFDTVSRVVDDPYAWERAAWQGLR